MLSGSSHTRYWCCQLTGLPAGWIYWTAPAQTWSLLLDPSVCWNQRPDCLSSCLFSSSWVEACTVKDGHCCLHLVLLALWHLSWIFATSAWWRCGQFGCWLYCLGMSKSTCVLSCVGRWCLLSPVHSLGTAWFTLPPLYQGLPAQRQLPLTFTCNLLNYLSSLNDVITWEGRERVKAQNERMRSADQ